jgi:hypothetical protein
LFIRAVNKVAVHHNQVGVAEDITSTDNAHTHSTGGGGAGGYSCEGASRRNRRRRERLSAHPPRELHALQ